MKEIFFKTEKKAMRIVAVLAMFTLMISVAGVSYNARKVELAAVEVSEHGTAGMVTVMTGVQNDAIATAITVDESRVAAVATQLTADMTVVSEADSQAAGDQAAASEPDPEWADKLMTIADDYMNVRTEPSSDAPLAGKLRRGDVAQVGELVDGWYEITSGNLAGYVSADYVVTGEEAKDLAYDTCLTYAKSTTGGLRVRSEPNEDSDIITALGEGERLEYNPEADTAEGWTAVKYGDKTGYIKSEYASVYLSTGTGITVEEEKQALEKAEAEKAAKAQKPANSVATVQNAPVSASYDDVTLLAALIQCEAGWEPYEGQVAVGAVVVNRLHSGYGGSLYDVIYARGQFSPAGSGQVAAAAAAGPRGSCIQAAQEALNGVDNTGGAKSFRPARTGHPGLVIGNHVFW